MAGTTTLCHSRLFHLVMDYEFGLLLGVGGEGRGIFGTESPSIPEKLLKVWRRGSTCSRGCIQRKKLFMELYAGIGYNSPYQLPSLHENYKGKGVELGRSLLLVEHICISQLISKTGFCVNTIQRRGRKGERADLISLN